MELRKVKYRCMDIQEEKWLILLANTVIESYKIEILKWKLML
jgi:phosphoribosylformylglycinamidine (FGAM) synthase PurS component